MLVVEQVDHPQLFMVHGRVMLFTPLLPLMLVEQDQNLGVVQKYIKQTTELKIRWNIVD